MSIYAFYNRNAGFESTLESSLEVENIEVQDFEEFHEEMVRESALDMARVNGGMYVAEQLIENALFTAEDHEVATLIEGAVKDFFEKLKESLQKLWNKIKAWFKHIVEVVKRFFMSGKELVKKHKSKIEKAAKDHSTKEVKCFKWNPDALANKTLDMISKLGYDELASDAYSDIVDKKDVDTTEVKKKVLALIGVEKVGEIAKELKDVARGGEKDTYTIGELNIGQFMTIVSSSDKLIKAVETTNKLVDKSMREGINSINEMARDAYKDEKDTEVVGTIKKAASTYTEIVRYGATLRTSVVKAYTSEVKAMSKQMTAVLKSLLNYAGSPKREGAKEGAFADIYDALGY